MPPRPSGLRSAACGTFARPLTYHSGYAHRSGLARVREAIQVRHYSRRTEQAYVHWIKRFIFFHGIRHPAKMGSVEVSQFLTHLAVEKKVSASTQNQAFNALLFVYKQVLGMDFGFLDGVVRARRPKRLPVVLTRHGESRARPTPSEDLWRRSTPQLRRRNGQPSIPHVSFRKALQLERNNTLDSPPRPNR